MFDNSAIGLHLWSTITTQKRETQGGSTSIISAKFLGRPLGIFPRMFIMNTYEARVLLKPQSTRTWVTLKLHKIFRQTIGDFLENGHNEYLWSTGTSKTPKYPCHVPVLHGYFKIRTRYSKNVPGTFEFMGTFLGTFEFMGTSLGTFLGTFGPIHKVFKTLGIMYWRKKNSVLELIYARTQSDKFINSRPWLRSRAWF